MKIPHAIRQGRGMVYFSGADFQFLHRDRCCHPGQEIGKDLFFCFRRARCFRSAVFFPVFLFFVFLFDRFFFCLLRNGFAFFAEQGKVMALAVHFMRPDAHGLFDLRIAVSPDWIAF